MDRDSVCTIAALADPVRAALFSHVRDAGEPVTREAAAAAVGVSSKLAAFHLDKLVAAGLLSSRLAPAGGRVGRAPLLYEPSGSQVTVSVPEREPGLLAEILAAAVLDERPGERARDAALRVARDRGRQVGAAERARLRPGRLGPERAFAMADAVLTRYGFRPAREATGVRLRNCPFHPLAADAPELVCALNHAFLSGILEGLGAESAVEAVLAPRRGACCVEILPWRGGIA